MKMTIINTINCRRMCSVTDLLRNYSNERASLSTCLFKNHLRRLLEFVNPISRWGACSIIIWSNKQNLPTNRFSSFTSISHNEALNAEHKSLIDRATSSKYLSCTATCYSQTYLFTLQSWLSSEQMLEKRIKKQASDLEVFPRLIRLVPLCIILDGRQ